MSLTFRHPGHRRPRASIGWRQLLGSRPGAKRTLSDRRDAGRSGARAAQPAGRGLGPATVNTASVT